MCHSSSKSAKRDPFGAAGSKQEGLIASEESNQQESDRVFIALLKMVSQEPLIWTMMKPLKENCVQLRNPLGPDSQNSLFT